ncbi:MAG TPA: zinc ribbon domain-containing protein [Thermoplasmata archaeon]
MAGGTGPVPPGATLFGLSGPRLRRLGVALLAVGLALFFLAILPVLLAINQFASDPWGTAPGVVLGSFFLSFVLSGIGMVLMGIGGYALRFGLVRPVTTYVATEASPGIETAVTAIGQGLRQAGFGPSPTGSNAIRVKCRNCGYLETEDADFCSKCGQRL